MILLLLVMALQPVLGPNRCQDSFSSVSIWYSSSPTYNAKGPKVLLHSNHLSLGLPARLLPSGLSKVSFITGFFFRHPHNLSSPA